MIDLIIICVIAGAFVLGFKSGQKFKSVGDLLQAGIDKFK